MSLLHSGQIRMFSPREMLNIFGFPDDFVMPNNMTTRQKYRAIGQSVNIVAVQAMMHSVFCSSRQDCDCHTKVLEDSIIMLEDVFVKSILKKIRSEDDVTASFAIGSVPISGSSKDLNREDFHRKRQKIRYDKDKYSISGPQIE